ncbi:MAG: M20/M25/M40 family metallo-hydrolase [Acutalibacteraceae bacterium]
MDTKDLCFFLSGKSGTSGDEAEARDCAERELKKYMVTRTDALGNLIGTVGSGKINILLDAHMDTIGLVIRGIDENGFLLFDKVGGVDARVLIGSEVKVLGKRMLNGVVCSTPPHLSSSSDQEKELDIRKMAIDVGLNKQQAQSVVEIGDRAVISAGQLSLLGDKIASPWLDDRCGAAAVIKAVEAVYDKIKNVRVTVLLSCGEEVGGFGAKTGAFSCDADYAIAVDVGFGADNVTPKDETIELSKGPSIGLSPVLDREFGKKLVSIAKNKNIPYQHDVMSGRTGTNADHINISKGGVKTALLSIPLRNMHTPVEVISIQDIDNTARLIAEFILETDGEASA